jgi:hypothetical protein
VDGAVALNAAVGDQWRIAYAERMRVAMGPEFCAIADALRETFGARLSWLETPEFQHGAHPGGEPIGEKTWLRARAPVTAGEKL